jgi:hypothetical protein
MGPRVLFHWNPEEIGTVPGQSMGTAGSINIRLGFYPNMIEAVKADGEPE